MTVQDILDDCLRKHSSVSGTSVAVLDSTGIHSFSAGQRNKTSPMTTKTWLEQASLSKTVGTAFAMELFHSRGLSFQDPVNHVLKAVGSPFQLLSSPGMPSEWAEQVQVKHLVNHTGLGMHYVFGIPLSREMPSVHELITNSPPARRYGYDAPLVVSKPPGTQFSYSGGGFLLLQHIVECLIGGRSLPDATAEFLASVGLNDATEFAFSFDPKDRPSATEYATGYLDDGSEVTDSRLMFPSFAAGALGTPAGLGKFLWHLAKAFKQPGGSGPISHATAVDMLGDHNLLDLGAKRFMNSRVGLGVFVAQAGDNKIMLHQAANDGFRGVYLVCFDGPDAQQGPKGIVVLSNGDNKAMFMNCDICKALMKDHLGFLHGFDWSRVEGKSFSTEGIGQEQIVNLGLKQLVFDAFVDPIVDVAARAGAVVPLSVLTEDAFAPFGQLVGVPLNSAGKPSEIANSGTAARYNWLAKLDNRRQEADHRARVAIPNVCVFSCKPRTLDAKGRFEVNLLERHLYSSQMFIPMTVPRRYLVVVALGKDAPDLSTLRAFVVDRNQGINYAPGVWHHPMVALDGHSDFACVVWEDGSEGDCHVVKLDKPVLVETEATPSRL